MNVISIGEVLWDVIGEAEHLGGAAFNFSAHLARLEHTVSFVSAIGEDERGERILQRMSQLRLSTRYISRVQGHPSGVVTVSLASGQPRYVLHRPAAYDFPRLTESQMKELFSVPTDWIYFGTLHQMSLQARQLTRRLLEGAPQAKRFYDVNLRQNNSERALVRDLMARATVVKLNDDEVQEVARASDVSSDSFPAFCRDCAARFDLEGICITRGARGCVALIRGEYLESDGFRVDMADAVGAGDAFAAAFLHGWSSGWAAARICDFANRVGALVASRPGAIPPWTNAEADALQHVPPRNPPRNHPDSHYRGSLR